MGRSLRVLSALLLAGLLLPVAGVSQAQESYRYWSYWWGQDGSWAYAEAGPADRKVSDGDVEGWRFLVSADAVPADQPRETPDFAAICDGAPADAGEIRVAVVIDYGTPRITPDGSTIPADGEVETVCAVVAEGSTGEQVINEVAAVRTEQGAVCGINGYPAAGCFDLVTGAAAEQDEPSGGLSWLWIAAALIALLALLAAVFLARGRRKPAA